VSVATKDGLNLGKTLFQLATETTVRQIREQAVFPIKGVMDLKRMKAPAGAGEEAKSEVKREVKAEAGKAEAGREAETIMDKKRKVPLSA